MEILLALGGGGAARPGVGTQPTPGRHMVVAPVVKGIPWYHTTFSPILLTLPDMALRRCTTLLSSPLVACARVAAPRAAVCYIAGAGAGAGPSSRGFATLGSVLDAAVAERERKEVLKAVGQDLAWDAREFQVRGPCAAFPCPCTLCIRRRCCGVWLCQ